MRRVIKFGGTSIATPEQVRSAAEHVARLVNYGEQIAVVVSAPGNLTNELLTAFYCASDNQAAFVETCEFVTLGEEQSVYLMSAALRSFDVPAQPFLPRRTENWPLVADVEDNSPLAACKINEERPFKLRTQQTVSRFRRFVLPHLRVGAVPVISGFFAVDSAERIVALGRGGSDITAFIVAAQISADELVIVTDVQGVLSADPRLADNPRLLEELTIEDLEIISSAGARVLHPRALKFHAPHLRVRLCDYRELDQLEQTGTSVLGRSQTTLLRNPEQLSMLTVLGEVSELAHLQETLLSWIREQQLNIASMSLSNRFACIYLPSQIADAAYASLHAALMDKFPELTSVSLRGEVGELKLRSGRFIDEPGVLAEVTGVIANARINIIEVITGYTDISVFINWSDMDRAETLLRHVLEHYTG